MERISGFFPNTLGLDGAVDNLTSFTDFITEMYAACEVVTQRVEAGQEWFRNYESMCLSLSKVRSDLPKVQLAITDNRVC